MNATPILLQQISQCHHDKSPNMKKLMASGSDSRVATEGYSGWQKEDQVLLIYSKSCSHFGRVVGWTQQHGR